MTTTQIATSAAHVSRVLAKRHFRSQSSSGLVKGYRSHSKGFEVRQTGTTAVVEHQSGSGVYRATDEADDVAALARYRATLEAAGFTVTDEGQGRAHWLRVGKAAS